MFYFSPLGLWCSILVFLAYRYRPTFRYWVFYSLGLGSFFHYHLGFSWDLLGSSILGFSFLCSSNTCRPTYCPNRFLASCLLHVLRLSFLQLTAARIPHIYPPSVSSRRSVSYYPFPCGLYLARI